MGAWNYPLHLTLAPLAGAIAAGNCAVIKPSEISPHTAEAIEKLLTKYLDPECFQVTNNRPPLLYLHRYLQFYRLKLTRSLH